MNKLFKTEIDFKKEASELIYLDTDPTNWVKQLITSFFTKFPQIRNMPVTLTWIKQDNEHGAAIGVLNALGGTIPIIIKGYAAYPLDTIMYQNAAIPLNEQTLNELMTSSSPFQGVAEINPKVSLQIFGDGKMNASPTEYGNNNQNGDASGVTRDAVKVANFGLSLNGDDTVTFIDKLAEMSKEDFRQFFNKFASESAEVKRAVDKSAVTNEVLHKYAEKAIAAKESDINFNIDRAHIFNDELGNSYVKLADSRFNFVKTEKLTPSLKKVAKNLYAPENFTEIPVSNTAKNEVITVPIEKGASGDLKVGDYLLNDVTVVSVENIAPTEKVAFFNTFDGKHGIIITEDGKWSYTEPNIMKTAESVEYSDPKIGDTGILVTGNQCSNFFKIESAVNNVIYGSSFLEKVAFSVSNHEILPTREEKVTFLPKSTKFVKLGKSIFPLGSDSSKGNQMVDELVKTANLGPGKRIVVTNGLLFSEIFVKSAESEKCEEKTEKTEKNEYKTNTEPVLIKKEKKSEKSEKTASYLPKNGVTCDSEGRFYLRGPEFQKFAELGNEIANLSKNDAIWASVMLGASEKDVVSIKNMNKNASYVYKNALKAPIALDSARNMVKIAQASENLGIWLLKEAAVINDKSSVDAILSLGLMNKANISEYVALIPDYERVLGELTKLLILARLGANTVPEGAVKSAVDTFSNVLYILKGVQQLQK